MGRVNDYIGDKFGQNATFCDNNEGNGSFIDRN